MEIKKALTFRASSIGDCLMGKYVLENIHAQFPNARLGIVVGSRGAMIRDLFAAYPWLEVIEVNRRNPRTLWSLWRDFYGSDFVVTQYAGKPGGRFGLASKLAARVLAKREGLVGFADASPWNGLIYDKLLQISQTDAVVEHDRAALRAAGMPVSLQYPTMQYVKDRTVLHTFHLEAGKFIVVHLFAGNKARGLHPDKKRELLLALGRTLPDTRLVVTGGVGDKEEAMRVATDTAVMVIAGEATLQEMMNLIGQSNGVVSVDTGIAHITAQLGKPLIVMRTCVGRAWWLSEQYGNDAPITVFDYDRMCKNGHLPKEYPACMDAIDMEEVAEKARAI